MEGKVHLNSTFEQVPSLVEQIRQIVREEVAAQLSQMQAKPIAIGPVAVGEAVSKYIDSHVRHPLTWNEADSQNKTWESARDTTWGQVTL